MNTGKHALPESQDPLEGHWPSRLGRTLTEGKYGAYGELKCRVRTGDESRQKDSQEPQVCSFGEEKHRRGYGNTEKVELDGAMEIIQAIYR